MKQALRFENLIRIYQTGYTTGGFELHPRENARILKGFTNNKHGDFITSYEPNYLYIRFPETGCVVMAGVNRLTSVPEMPDKTLWYSHVVNSGYAAFVFDGKSWQDWRCPHDVEVYSEFTDGLEVSIKGLRGKELVRVNSHGHRHELISFEHALDYCAGKRSLADILALVEMEERRRSQNERQMTYKELLTLARSFKGTVRSKTAAKIEELLVKLAGEDLPF